MRLGAVAASHAAPVDRKLASKRVASSNAAIPGLEIGSLSNLLSKENGAGEISKRAFQFQYSINDNRVVAEYPDIAV
jgi:hypothetical protein